METKEHDKQWHLIRNDNGEWISDEYAVFLSELEASVLRIRATNQKQSLSIQHGVEGQIWCYRHEYEAIDMSTPPTAERELRIKKSTTKK